MRTLGSLHDFYQGVADKKKKESGQSTRRKYAHMHTREGGGVNSDCPRSVIRSLLPPGFQYSNL